MYYNSSCTTGEDTGRHFWVDFTDSQNKVTTNELLSRSHRRAAVRSSYEGKCHRVHYFMFHLKMKSNIPQSCIYI